MLNFHPQQLKLFKQMQENDELAHAFLFTGSEGVGKLEFAREISFNLQQLPNEGGRFSLIGQLKSGFNHPDIIEMPSPLPIEEAKELKKRLRTSPFSGKYKIVIIPRAESMHTDAANSLLKTIEEPRGDTIFILCSAYPKLILETIRSRCFEVKFSYVQDEIIEKEFDIKTIENLKLHWTGRPSFAEKLLEDDNYRKKINEYRKDYKTFIKGSLSERFNISEKYAKMDDRSRFLEVLRVWMENIRAQENIDKNLLQDMLNLYQNTISTNANIRYALNNVAIKM